MNMNAWHVVCIRGEIPDDMLSAPLKEFALLIRRAWKYSTKIGHQSFFNKVPLSDDTQLEMIKETRYAIKYIYQPTEQATKLHKMLWEL